MYIIMNQNIIKYITLNLIKKDLFLCTFAAKPDGNSVSNLLLRPNLKKNNVYETVTIDGFSLKIKLTVNDFKGSLIFSPKR